MATKIPTASGAFNAYFLQQGHGSIPNTHGNGEPAVSDLHLKMSKKIAQLTKVVYALNSKNDESENLISNLKSQFEEEKEQLFHETNKKMEQFKVQVYTMNDNSKVVAELETKLNDFQSQRIKALQDFEAFKTQSIQSESRQSEEHRAELAQMTKLLENLRADQEAQQCKFESISQKIAADKDREINEIMHKHRLEIDSLKEMQLSKSSSDTDGQLVKLKEAHEREVNSLQTDMANLLEKFNQENAENEENIEKLKTSHEKDMQKLRSEVDELGNKLKQDMVDHDQNIQKLKLFHEKELEARSQNNNSEYLQLIENLKSDLENLKKEKCFTENELNKKYMDTLNEVGLREEEIEVLKEKLQQMEIRLENNGSNSNKLNDAIIKSTDENKALQAKLAELEFENSSFKNRFEFQAKNLLEKSSEISQLEASNLQKNSTISDIQHELTATKTRLEHIEEERRALENESLNQNDRNTIMIRSLENQVKSLTEEMAAHRANYQAKIESLTVSNSQEVDQLKMDFKLEREALVTDYEARLASEQTEFNEKVLNLEVTLNKNFSAENQRLVKEKGLLKESLEKSVVEAKLKIDKYESDLTDALDKLRTTEEELKKITQEHWVLNELKSKLDNEYSTINEFSEKQTETIRQLTEELSQLKFLHESTNQDAQVQLKCQLDMLNKELNSKWQERLRNELEALRKELQKSMEAEKRDEIAMLNNLKDGEIKNLKSVWQTKTNELLDEVSQLKRDLGEKEENVRVKFELLKNSLELENYNLSEQLAQLEKEHNAKLEKLKAMHEGTINSLTDRLTKENIEKIANIKQMHLEDLKAQTIAQKAALGSFKTSIENSKNHEIELLNQAHQNAVELAKQEAEQAYFIEMDNMKQENDKEMMMLRVELERAIEISQQKEREFEVKQDEFQQEMRMKQKLIERSSEEICQLKAMNAELKGETDSRVKELKRMKHELQVEFKNKETMLQQRIEEEISHLNLENSKQKQMLVNEFKHAQEILKEKIYETEESLRQMHEKYLNRESREEDLEMIKELTKNLNAREELFKKMEEEKKYFQMELVNRDNNFTKVFNSNMNVGCINPLNSNTKVKKKGFSSTSNMSFGVQSSVKLGSPQMTRLDPISGVESPMHDIKLNPNKPLPKKFII